MCKLVELSNTVNRYVKSTLMNPLYQDFFLPIDSKFDPILLNAQNTLFEAILTLLAKKKLVENTKQIHWLLRHSRNNHIDLRSSYHKTTIKKSIAYIPYY